LAGSGGLGLAWAWLSHAQALQALAAEPAADGSAEEGPAEAGLAAMRTQGARALLRPGSLRSEAVRAGWTGLETRRTVRLFRSEERAAVLRLCGWGDRGPGIALPDSDPVAKAARQAADAVFK
jgi:hypothetical protein